MNTPRIKLSLLQRDQAGPVSVNGATPKVRPRDQLAAPSPHGTTGRQRERRWLAPLPLAGIALIAVALIGYWAIYAAGAKRTQILVAAHALSAGSTLTSGDLRVGELAGESSVLSTLVPAGEASRLVGQRIASTVPVGTPLARGALAAGGSRASVITLAVPAYDLAGGLAAGDHVTVLATFGAGSGQQAVTRPVARGLEVISVGEVPADEQQGTSSVPVALALSDPSTASVLVLAEQDGKIDLLIEGSGAATAVIPQATQQGGNP